MVVSARVTAIAAFGRGALGRTVFHLDVQLVNQSKRLPAGG